jgi:wyosine [tRNA(Phe)-imidazoG37] synthetase (radical SAM superfamily)
MSESNQESQKLRYIYGPVPSRRLGQSLGVDPIPLKTCNWNCVYCQLGRTRPVVIERKEYILPDKIMGQLDQALEQHKEDEIDWITFVGSGEPVLNAGIGWMIRQVKSKTDIPVAVITNGTFLDQAEVREALSIADAVLPSLDAGTAELYRRINRPHPHATFERHLQGLIAFSREYKGHYWPEVMLIKGLNDTEPALRDLAAAFQKIKPEKIHLNLPTRPPVETWVSPPDQEGLMRATAILGDITHVVHPIEGVFDLSGYDNVIEAVIGIITRHPMREDILQRTLSDWAPGEVHNALSKLSTSGRAQLVERCGARFWSAAGSFYPDMKHSERSSPPLQQ